MVRRCISASSMSSMCVQIIQRCPYGSRSEPARSPWNVSDGSLTAVAPASTARVVERVGVLGVDHQRDRTGSSGVGATDPNSGNESLTHTIE